MVSKASDHTIQSVVSVKVTSDIVAQCNVSNMMGTEVKVFSIRTSKSPTHQVSVISLFPDSSLLEHCPWDGVNFSVMIIQQNYSV